MAKAMEIIAKCNVVTINKTNDQDTDNDKDDNNYEKYVLNQKWGLCEALLVVGDWKTAEMCLNKLPEHSVIDNEPIALALCNLIHQIIEPIHRAKCLLSPYITGHVIQPHRNKSAPPTAKSFIELREYAFPMIAALGPALRYDSKLIYKLLRLMRQILTEINVASISVAGNKGTSDNELLYYDIITLLDTSFLPALSYMDCNCCVAEEIWTVVKFYPYEHRYSLYARWKNDTSRKQLKLMKRCDSALKQIKTLMNRVSKENIKPIGRLIGKLSHSSPGFLFDYILLQIKIHDNYIGPVVDCLKYLTSLSYDVLGYCLIEALAKADRDRLKHDGTSISLWLQSLANFCGCIFKKYNIELSGLLQYVANQLKNYKR